MGEVDSLLDLLEDAGRAPAEAMASPPAPYEPDCYAPSLPPSLYEPRPDLADDSGLWEQLLTLAFREEGEAAAGGFGVLHGMRCCGARLERQAPSGQLRIVGDCYDGDWSADRERWLLPHRVQIAAWMRQVAP